MAKGISSIKYKPHGKIRRPGVHSKNNNSIHKASKNYVKRYNSQGR